MMAASGTPSLRLVYVLTDAAGRDDNEDACDIFTFGPNDVLVVADGAGGHAGGATASATMIAAASKHFESLDIKTPLGEALEGALHAGQKAVRATAKTSIKFRDMRTTALLVIGTTTEAWVAHVGDSRAYLVRDGVAKKLTRDDSLVQTLVDLGELDEQAAKKHSKANVLSQSIGDPKELEYHVSGPISVNAGDRIVACSDGLWEVMTDAEIGEMSAKGDPTEVAKRLVMHAIESHADDNVTVGVIAWLVPGKRPVTAKKHVDARDAARSRKRAQQRNMNLLVLVLLVLVVAVAAIVRLKRDHDRHALDGTQGESR